MSAVQACDECLRRSWLLGRLSGHIDLVRKNLWEILCLDDADLISAVAGKSAGRVRAEHRRWGHGTRGPQLERARVAGTEMLCRCQRYYPRALIDLEGRTPSVLYVAGDMTRFLDLCNARPVAIVGSRKCSEYGRRAATDLGARLVRAGLTVVSGMAAGIDTAAHKGALTAGGNTIAVMPCAAEQSYPAGSVALHRRIVQTGAAVSELPPGSGARAWTFKARNRIVVALAEAVVVVQAAPDSGTMLTAQEALALRRKLGAVPGQINAKPSAGPNTLIKAGQAELVDGAAAVLDMLHLPGCAQARRAAATPVRPLTTEPQRQILLRIENGEDSASGLSSSGIPTANLLKDLAVLELTGWIRRAPGGRFLINE